jgi:hypothetical protein
MTEAAISIPPTLISAGASRKDRARGAMVGAVFGSAWMLWAAVFVPAARTAALTGITVMVILLVGWAASCVRVAGRYQDSIADRERWASIAPLFWIDTAAEWVLGAGAVIALAHFGRYALIPQFLGVIIGLHFLPLARLLRAPRSCAMGTVMILCVLASVLVPEGSLRNVIACAGVGLPMWVTAVVILSQDLNAVSVRPTGLKALERIRRRKGIHSWASTIRELLG